MNDPRLISIATRLADLSRELDEILRSAVAPSPPVDAAVTTVPVAIESRSLLITQRQFAELLGVHVRTFQRMRSDGEVPPPLAIGARPKWRRSDAERWIAERSDR